MGKHLDFYYNCLLHGKMQTDGLCVASDEGLIDLEIFNLISPTDAEEDYLYEEGYSKLYWGAGLPGKLWGQNQFTPLRQTIVLFMAAMNNEL